MKRIITTLILLTFAVSAFAQIQYVPTETRRSGSGTSNAPSSSSQLVTTTAYAISGDSYVKARVKIQITDNGYGGSYIKVVEKYDAQGLGMNSQWRKVYNSGFAQRCSPMASMNPLESQFMYKVSFDTKIWYFDL